MSSNWKIDEKIDATAICEQANWHLATAVADLCEAGLDRDDAEAFAAFVFDDHAAGLGGTIDGRPEDRITDEQWARLSV